jgi:hypothetical protein
MEYDQRIIILFLCKEHVSAEDMNRGLKAQFGDPNYSEHSWRSVQRWYEYVRQGREDLQDEVRSGRPPTDFLGVRILALPDEQPFIRLIRLPKNRVFLTQLC